MIITKPENTEDLYPLFKQILVLNHKPDPHSWGRPTFTGKGFYLKLEGEYSYDYVRKNIEIEHPDKYFSEKFRVYNDYSETVYRDRFIIITLCKDMRGRVQEWKTYVYQHLKQ